MTQDNYSLMQGGLVHRLLHASGALHRTRRLSWWLAAVLVVVSLLPMLVLAHAGGMLWPRPPAMALLGDYATLARLLLALPLLILAAPRADALLRSALRQLAQASLVHPRRQPRLQALLHRVRRCRDSRWPELVCIALAFAPLCVEGGAVSLLPGVTDWRLQGGTLTPAGQWYAWVGMPLFRLVGLLWLWRFALWTMLLLRLPSVGLALHAEHPDRSGGLAFLGLAQERFSILAAAGGLILAGASLNHTTYLGLSLYDQRHLLAGYVVGVTLLLVAPLLLLTPALIRTRRHALYRFDALGNRAASVFDARWRAASDLTAGAESLLDHNDASAYADFSGVYQGVVAMSVVPLTRWNLLWIALPAALPLLPLVLLAMSVDELVAKLAGILV
ncbi:hypothetical protein [Stenotrophomonas sp.]|uniref:hypothetical protein n=1 Tax=Stenotrophomonas sp. TaxID=69392 RepID=UPI0028AE96BA|nr:hypothetical protein [Stenotrophomonas sp.]